jgi:hypothetical protein
MLFAGKGRPPNAENMAQSVIVFTNGALHVGLVHALECKSQVVTVHINRTSDGLCVRWSPRRQRGPSQRAASSLSLVRISNGRWKR